MSSLFKDSKSITDEQMFYKVLAYGPRGVGKTHFMLSAPEVAVLDLENRAHHFRTLFDFKIAGLDTIESVREGFREIIRGGIACKTVGIDSDSAMYQRLVDKYTTTNKDGKPVTDYVLVNKDMLAFTGFTFSIRNKNVVLLRHQVDKLIRQGNQFQKDGVKSKGDAQIEYAVDFILRFAWDGKQRVAVVEKSVYAQVLPVGSVLRDPSWSSLMAAITPKDVQRQNGSQAGAAPANGTPASRPSTSQSAGEPHPERESHAEDDSRKAIQLRAIESICKQHRISDRELVIAVDTISDGDHQDVRDLSEAQRGELIKSLQKVGAA